MKATNLFAVVLAVVFGLSMVACFGPDNTTEIKKTEIINQPTVGQQIEDLDKAYKNGAITKEEYEKTKKGILEKAAPAEKK